MNAGAGIAFTLICLLLAWLVWRSREDAGGGLDSRFWLRLRSALPPLLLIACLPDGCARDRFDSLRLYATGMVVTERAVQGGRRIAIEPTGCDAYLRAGEDPIFVVGRNRACVDLVVQDPNGAAVEGALLKLVHPPGGAPELRLASLGQGGGAMIAAYDNEEGRSYVGALALADGDSLCVVACEGTGARWWTFRDDGRLESAGVEPVELPVRSGLYGRFAPFGPERRVYPLPSPAGTTTPPVSFLFQNDGAWQAMLLDPAARLRRADGAVIRPQPTVTLSLPQDSRLHLAMLSLRGDRLVERRSFTLSNQFGEGPGAGRRFGLTLDTPELAPIGQCDQPLSRLALAPDQSTPDSFSLGAFGNRPGSVLASAAAGLPIDRFNLCRSVTHSFASPLDDAPGAAETPVLRQLSFRADRLGLPWLLPLIALLTALMVHVASERLWRTNRLDGQILILVQFLLVLRAIIGVGGVFADPSLPWRQVYADAAIAMVALPAILVAVRARADSRLSVLAGFVLFTLLALVAIAWWVGPLNWINLLIASLALVALAGRAASLLLAGRPLPSLRAALLGLSPRLWLPLLGLIVVARLLLFAFGFRERVFGVTLSAVYVPLLLVVMAAVIARAEAAPAATRWRNGVQLLLALALGAFLVALAIRDIGFALVHVPPIAGIALWRFRRWRRDDAAAAARPWRDALPWAAPAAAMVGIYVAALGFVLLTPPPGADAPLEQRVAYAVADTSNDQNWLRLRAVFAPRQIAAIGTENAAVQLDQSLLLGEFTGRLLGRGYLEPFDLGSFRYQAVHFSDYLSAVHIMGPFGRAGAAAMLIVLAAVAAAAVQRRVPYPAPWPSLAGALAIWTLFGAAAYMVLANLLLVPFTGRNIYLLSPLSGGDLIEGLGLLLMARIGLDRERAA